MNHRKQDGERYVHENKRENVDFAGCFYRNSLCRHYAPVPYAACLCRPDTRRLGGKQHEADWI